MLLVAAAAVLFPLDRWGEYVGRLTQTGSQLNVSAFNLWHLALGVSQSLGPGATAAITSFGVIAGYAAVPALGPLVAAMVWRRPHVGVALTALVLTLGAFVLLPVMRERYLLGALPFAVLLATGWESGRVSRAGVVAAVALSATQFLNLVAVGSPLPGLWTNVFAPIGSPLSQVVAALGYVAALANVAVLAWAVRRLAAK